MQDLSFSKIAKRDKKDFIITKLRIFAHLQDI